MFIFFIFKTWLHFTIFCFCVCNPNYLASAYCIICMFSFCPCQYLISLSYTSSFLLPWDRQGGRLKFFYLVFFSFFSPFFSSLFFSFFFFIYFVCFYISFVGWVINCFSFSISSSWEGKEEERIQCTMLNKSFTDLLNKYAFFSFFLE